MIECENYLCIYEQNGVCLLDRVVLDIQGQCPECLYVGITPEELQQRKARDRRILHEP